jgi:hypothetical protein
MTGDGEAGGARIVADVVRYAEAEELLQDRYMPLIGQAMGLYWCKKEGEGRREGRSVSKRSPRIGRPRLVWSRRAYRSSI